MIDYEVKALRELGRWKIRMSKRPSLTNKLSKGVQKRINNLVPDKVHKVITEAIKNMTKAVLIGSKFTTKNPLDEDSLKKRERLVKESLEVYKKTAAATGIGTGAGGVIAGLADFPILLSLKMKFLFSTASFYGFDVRDYRERLYILHIFQLAFCSQQRRLEVYKKMVGWKVYVNQLPESIDDFDWRSFQQEYRDYIDLAKLLQLVPGIGAVVGGYANYKLMDKLGETAINAYRLRILDADLSSKHIE